MGIFQKYFFYNLHDSTVLQLNKTNNGDLYLKLNDIATEEFAYALIDKKKINIKDRNLQFPITIHSEKTIDLSLNTVNTHTGEIIPSKMEKLQEYLYEEIIDWKENNIEIAFDLWHEKGFRYLLYLHCEKLSIIEEQDYWWNKYFGSNYDGYYHYFKLQKEEEKYLSDYSLCEKLIDYYDSIEK